MHASDTARQGDRPDHPCALQALGRFDAASTVVPWAEPLDEDSVGIFLAPDEGETVAGPLVRPGSLDDQAVPWSQPKREPSRTTSVSASSLMSSRCVGTRPGPSTGGVDPI